MSTVLETNRAKEISKEIYKQLGGNKFVVMTGSKIKCYETLKDGVALHIGLKRNKSKANLLIVKYNDAIDLYEMKFLKFSMKKGLESIREFENIYCDQLQELFTEVTGFYTKL